MYFDAESERYIKITHATDSGAGGFALTVDTRFKLGKQTQCYIGVPFLREATPLEYLSRLQLFNRTFRDLIDVVGVIDKAGKEAIVTSQPRIKGGYADEKQVREFMEARGFVMVPNVVAGRRNSVSYFREADRVAVFDTHGQNFLVSGARTGPIDALIITADEELTAFLSMPAEERRKEIGQWTSQMHGF